MASNSDVVNNNTQGLIGRAQSGPFGSAFISNQSVDQPAEDEAGRFGASADQMQYLLGASLEFLSEGVGFDNLSAYWGAVRAKNKAQLEQYDRLTFEKARKEGNDLSKYFLDLLVIDGATLITSALAATATTALTGGGTLAALSGAGIASFVLNAGDTFAESVDAVGKENVDKGLVLGASLLMAGLDAALPGKIGEAFVSRSIREKVKASAAKNLAKNKWLTRAVKVGFQSGLTESGTEAMQEVLQAATINAQEGKDPFDFSEEQIAQFQEAAWAGGFLGFGAGASTSGVGRSSARKIIGRKEEAVAQLDSELELKIAELEAERTSLAEQKRNFKIQKRSNDIRKEISELRVEANKKKAKIWGADSEAAINKIVPIKEQETESEAAPEAAPEKEKTLAKIMAEDPRTSTPLRTQPGAVLPEGTQRGPSPTQEEINARLAQEPSGPTQADVMPDVMPGTPVAPRPGTATAEAAARADEGLAQEEFDPSAALGTPVAPREGTVTANRAADEAAARADARGSFPMGEDPSVFLDSAPDQTGAGPQGRPRRSFAAIRAAREARDQSPQVMNRPVINTVIGDGENVLVDGDVLITATDIEEAKFAKASRELEDIAMEAESNAFEQAEADGMDYPAAVAAAEAARNTVLQEGGARRTRVYSSRAARLQAQREAAEQRQKRADDLTARAKARVEEEERFEAKETAKSKEVAISMADDFMDFLDTNATVEEIQARRNSDIAILSDRIGGQAAVNQYRKNASRDRINKILEARGPEGGTDAQVGEVKDPKPTKKKATKKKAAKKPAEEVPPKGGVGSSGGPTQAEVTPPAPEAAGPTGPAAFQWEEGSTVEFEVEDEAGSTSDLPPDWKEGDPTTIEVTVSGEVIRQVGSDGTVAEFVERVLPNGQRYKVYLTMNGKPTGDAKNVRLATPKADSTPTQADATPPVPDTPTETAPVAAEDTEAAPATTPQGEDTTPAQEAETKPDETAEETGKATTPPDVAVTDVDEDQTQDQQIAEMRAKEQATVARETADQEADAEFQAGTDDTGPTVEDVEGGVDIPEAGTIAATPDLEQVDIADETVTDETAIAETVIEEPTPTEVPVLEYAETTANPDGVPMRIYEDPDNPNLNIVEVDGKPFKQKYKDRARAVAFANRYTRPRPTEKAAKAAPKARPEGKTYTGPKPKGASESLVKWMGGTAPFRATIGKQRASQARNVGLDPDQYTTEEELYDAIVAQVEAEPVEVVEPAADIAEEVQRVAEEIVPETNLERIAREATERRVKENAIMVEQDFTPQEIAEMEQFEDRNEEVESGLMEDIDADIEAEIEAQEAESEAARATRKLEIESEKVSFETVDNMEVADFLQLAQTPRKPGWSKQQLVQIANNIQSNDPTVSFDTKKKRADLAQELIAWKESGVTIDDSILEPEYQDDVTSDGDFYSAPSDDTDVTYGFDNKKSTLKDVRVSEEEISNVERSINNNLELMFSKRKAAILKRLKFINMINSSEANSLGIEGDSIASYASGDVKVYFVLERIAKFAKAQNKDVDKLTRSLIMHEVGVHAGKNVFSGQEFDLVLDQVVKLYDQKDPTFVNAFNVVAKDYPDLTLFERKFNEEVLAHVIESKAYEMETINKSFFDKLKTAFQKFFEKLFYTVSMDKTRADNLTPDVTAEDMFNLIAGHSMRNIYSYALKRHGDSKNFSNVRTRNRDRFIENSVVKTPMFHGGYYNFSAPVLDKTELGLHVGTEKAALDRVFGDGEKLKKGYIKVKNPFYSEDLNFWESWGSWLRGINYQYEKDLIDDTTYRKLLKVVAEHKAAYNKLVSVGSPTMADRKHSLQKQFSEDMRNALIQLGYDSISYINLAEDLGSTSYILLKDNQFKDVDSLMFRSGTNVFMDKKVVEQEPDQAVVEPKKISDIAGPQVTNTRKAQGKMFQALKKVQRAIEPLMTIEGYDELETQRMLAKGEIGKWHNYGRVVFDVLYQANAKEKKAILKYFETRGASPDDLPTRKVPVAKLPTVARGTRAKGSMAENRSIRDVAVQAKREIEELGANLVKAGLITDEQYKKWQGQYLPKTYLKYIEKDRIARGIGTSRMTYTKVRSAHENFLKDVMEGRIEDPAFLAGRYISMAGADLSTINYLKFLAADTGKNGWVLPNQTINYEGMDGTVGYWNEYVNEMRSNITRMRELNPNKAKEMEKISDAIQKKIDSVGDIPSAEGYKKVPDNVRYGAMRGLFVKKEIIDDVMGLESLYTNNEVLNNVLSYSSKATKVFKYTKVPMNIPTQARNVISNVVLMDVSGTNFLRIPGLISRAITDIVKDGEYAQLARKYGIESTTFASEELVNMDRELLKLKAEKDSWSGMWAKSKIFFNDYLDVGGRAYQKTEVMFKVAKMIDLMENHGKSEAEAARLANEALLDYSNVSQGVRVIRSMPLGSPFITFNLKAGAQMIRNIRNHPIAVAKYAAIPYIISEMLLDNNDDIEEEDIPAMQKLVADYMEGNLTTMILPWKDDEGRLRVFDMGYFLPWGAHLSMAKNLMEGEFGEAAKTPGFFGGPFELVAGIKTNVDPFTGQEIWNESDPPLQRYQDMLGFMASYAMPPMLWPRNKSGDVIGNGGQLIKTLMAIGFLDGNIDVDGLPKNTIPSSMLSWLGINTSPLTKETAGRKLFFKGRYAKSIQSRLLKLIDDPNISEEDRNRLIDEYRMHQQNALDKYREYSEAYTQVSDVL